MVFCKGWILTLQRTYIYSISQEICTRCFVVLCFVVVMQSFIMNSHEVFIHIHQGCFAGTGAIVRLPQCQWSKPDGYGKISQRITTTKHSKAKTVCIFLGIYCIWMQLLIVSFMLSFTCYVKYIFAELGCLWALMGPLLPTWFYFYPNMDK